MVALVSQRRGGRSPARPARAWRTLLYGVVALLLTGCTPPGLPDPITPSGVTSVPTSPPDAGTIVIGLDGTAGRIPGFNPYSIADFSPASQAAASLVLPSAFVVAADGTLVPDLDVIDKAEVTTQDPFTVTYTLDRKASWSDGTPITAEDFSYLRDQLVVQPGTVNPAGYQLISQIRSRDAGKQVEVEFSEQFPDWPTLFSPLLPSHLMKDFPGGWSAALGADLPVSANRFKMNSYDPVTGQVSLARNDKYWGTPPQPAAVVLRLGDPTDLLEAFSRGDVQALWFAPTGSTASSLQEAVPADLRTVVPIPASTQLIFNTTSGPTQVQSIRTAIAAGVTQSVVAADLTGGWPDGGSTVTSQVRLPSEAGDAAGPDGDTVAQSPVVTGEQAASSALAGAGYLRNGLYVSRAGEVLRLTLGYPSGDPRLAAAARTIQRQLGAIGIEIDLLPDATANLVDTRIASGAIDLALLIAAAGDIGRGLGRVCLRVPDRQRPGDRLHRHDQRTTNRHHRSNDRQRVNQVARRPRHPLDNRDDARHQRRFHAGPAHRQSVRLLPPRDPGNPDRCPGRPGGGDRRRPVAVGGSARAAADPAVCCLRRRGTTPQRARRTAPGVELERSAQWAVRLASELMPAGMHSSSAAGGPGRLLRTSHAATKWRRVAVWSLRVVRTPLNGHNVLNAP